MNNMIRVVGLTALCLGMTLSAASADWNNYSPTVGAPWTSGTTSHSWTSWSYGDNVITNNSGSARTWTVPMMTRNALAGSARSVNISFADGMSNTSAQVVGNNFDGVRFFSGGLFNAPFASLSTQLAGSVVYPLQGTVYVNYVVGRDGGRISTTSFDL